LLKRGVSIACLSYTCFLSDDQIPEMFLDFNEVVRPAKLQGGGRVTTASAQSANEDDAVSCFPIVLQKMVHQGFAWVTFSGRAASPTAF
jgi:hypothetical protein